MTPQFLRSVPEINQSLRASLRASEEELVEAVESYRHTMEALQKYAASG